MRMWNGLKGKLVIAGMILGLASSLSFFGIPAHAELTLDEFLSADNPLLPHHDPLEQSRDGATAVVRTNVITIDTRDTETCRKTVKDLNLGIPICDDVDANNPFVSIFGLKNISHREYLDQRGQEYMHYEYQVPKLELDEKGKTFLRQNEGIILLGVAAFGALVAAPPSVSKWDSEDKMEFLSSMPSKWSENVKEGPVIDEDEM